MTTPASTPATIAPRLPLFGETAPAFAAQTTQGPINFPEIKRLLIALQTTDAHGCATPADWQPGDDVIVPPPGSCGSAKERMEQPDADTYALDWFMPFRRLPKAKLNLPPAARV